MNAFSLSIDTRLISLLLATMSLKENRKIHQITAFDMRIRQIGAVL